MVRALTLLLFVMTALTAAAQNDRVYTEDAAWLQTWQQREAELNTWKKLKLEEISDEVKLKAIEWLQKDVDASRRYFARTQQGLGEAYGDYYIELVLFITKLKDRRSIPVLAEVMDVAPRVSTTLAEFGDEAVPPVMKKLGDEQLASDAAFTLGTFVRGKAIGRSPIGEPSVIGIRDALLKTLEHRSFVTRKAAVNALEHIGPDPKVIAALQRVARTDPYVRSIPAGKRNPAIAQDYPVRNAAAAVLEKLEKPARERTP